MLGKWGISHISAERSVDPSLSRPELNKYKKQAIVASKVIRHYIKVWYILPTLVPKIDFLS